jgi:hypothetical protein
MRSSSLYCKTKHTVDPLFATQPAPGLFVFDPIIPHLFNDADPAELKAMLDGTFAPEVAQAFIDGSGVEWEVVERDVGHCGCVTKPKIVAEVILDAVQKFAV